MSARSVVCCDAMCWFGFGLCVRVGVGLGLCGGCCAWVWVLAWDRVRVWVSGFGLGFVFGFMVGGCWVVLAWVGLGCVVLCWVGFI